MDIATGLLFLCPAFLDIVVAFWFEFLALSGGKEKKTKNSNGKEGRRGEEERGKMGASVSFSRSP